MPAKVAHSIWVSSDLDTLVRNHANTLGLRYNNIVIDALNQFFKYGRDPMSVLMQDLRMWLLSKFSRSSFPDDVTLQTFMHIQRSPTLLQQYNDVLAADTGRRAQATLNRRIGQAVRQILDGRVTVRKVGATHCRLIKVYSKLIPAT